MLPGVELDPPTVSQGADPEVDAVNARICETRLEVTGIADAGGTADVPAVTENDALALERTRSAAFGLMFRVTGRFAVACAESVTTSVKLPAPGVDGVPPICPLDTVSPSGRDPLTENV